MRLLGSEVERTKKGGGVKQLTRKEYKLGRKQRRRRARKERHARARKRETRVLHKAITSISAWFASFRTATPKQEHHPEQRSERSQAWRKRRKELGWVPRSGKTLVPITLRADVLRWRARKGDREAKRKLAA